MTHEEFIKKISKCWEIVTAKHPSVRFGEMIANSANYGMIYYSTEDELLQSITYYYNINPADLEEVVEEAVVEEVVEETPVAVSYVYVNKDGVAKRILSTELEEYLAQGYKKGRK